MISICVASCGEDRWRALAEERAIPSARTQGVEVIAHYDGGTDNPSVARNAAAEMATQPYLIFLDADDELAPGYVDHMRQAIIEEPALYVPMVSYVNGRRVQEPKYWPQIPLVEGNWLVIGTMLERRAFLNSGGFSPWIDLYEDWHLFARMWKNGASLVRVPEAVYIAHVSNASRNRNRNQHTRFYWHQKIGHDVWPDHYEPTTPKEDERRALFPPALRFVS